MVQTAFSPLRTNAPAVTFPTHFMVDLASGVPITCCVTGPCVNSRVAVAIWTLPVTENVAPGVVGALMVNTNLLPSPLVGSAGVPTLAPPTVVATAQSAAWPMVAPALSFTVIVHVDNAPARTCVALPGEAPTQASVDSRPGRPQTLNVIFAAPDPS